MTLNLIIINQPHNNQSSHETVTHPAVHTHWPTARKQPPFPPPPGSSLTNKARMLAEGVFYS